jgi:hypothetical protein
MVMWMFEDYRHNNSWVAFDDPNQQLLESAWQITKRYSLSQGGVVGAGGADQELCQEESLVEIQDSHFLSVVSVCPRMGFAYYDSGDLVIDRFNSETGFGEHEWLAKELLRCRDEADDTDGDDDDCSINSSGSSSSDDEQKHDLDITVRKGGTSIGGIPICPVKEQSRRDEGYGSYESRSSVNSCSPPGSDKPIKK